MDNNVTLQIGAVDNSEADIARLRQRIADIKGKTVTISADDKQAQLAVDRLNAKLTSLGRRSESAKISVSGAARMTAEVTAAELALGKLGGKEEDVGGQAAGLGSDLGALSGNAMPALVGAVVALSPVIATLGVGFGGLGIAAVGVIGPIERAAKAQGGLAANMGKLDPLQRQVARSLLGLGQQYDKFQASLKPEILGAFNQGIKIAGGLLHDIQPVAAATGRAFDQFLGQVGQMFRSGEWQSFFQFMARNAGPDMKLLGSAVINLADSLPPLIQNLQPVAIDLLNVANGLIVLVRYGSEAAFKLQELWKAAHNLSNPIGIVAHAIGNVVDQVLPFVPAVSKAAGAAGKLGASSLDAGSGVKSAIGPVKGLLEPVTTLGGNAHTTAGKLDALASATNRVKNAYTALSKLLSNQSAYDQWKSAQNAVTAAIHHGTIELEGNSNKAIANRDKVIAATQASLQFAQQQSDTRGGVKRASDSIQNQINFLQGLHDKSKFTRDEIEALKDEEQRLKDKFDALNAERWKEKHITVNARGVASSNIPGVEKALHADQFGIRAPGMATGGVAAPGWAWVGERGPELVNMTGGETVLSNPQSVKAARGYAGGTLANWSGPLPGMGQYEPTAVHFLRDAQSTALAAGMTLMLEKAVRQAQQRAGISSLHGIPGGSGVNRWGPLVTRALNMEGLNPMLAARVMFQMQTESGGNPRAINLTDINAQHGDPSRGLMQVIMSTFRAYHWPGTSWNIYDPLANIAAALNYGRHTYGPTLMRGGMGIGSGHGYDQGGWLPTGWSMAYNGTGRPEPVGQAIGQRVVLEVHAGQSDFDRFMVTWLQRAVRTKGGGDVQLAFGSRS